MVSFHSLGELRWWILDKKKKKKNYPLSATLAKFYSAVPTAWALPVLSGYFMRLSDADQQTPLRCFGSYFFLQVIFTEHQWVRCLLLSVDP